MQLHILHKHALSKDMLENLLRRSNVSNVAEALRWFDDILKNSRGQMAEYLRRHRARKLKLTAPPSWKVEVLLDLFLLAGRWHLAIAEKRSRYLVVRRLLNRLAQTVKEAFHSAWLLQWGAVHSATSDVGGEFISYEFLQLCSDFGIYKDCSPSYAHDRLSLIDRSIRTLRESAERSLRGEYGNRDPASIPNAVLDTITGTVANAVNNDKGIDGYSASERQVGRSTSPFVTALQQDLPQLTQEPFELQRTAEAARQAFHNTSNGIPEAASHSARRTGAYA